MSDPETVAERIGEQVTETIEASIENAQIETDLAAETADMIAKAAMETERGNRVSEIERRLDEWQNNQADQSEAIAALTLGLTQLSGQMSVLLTQAQSPTPNPPSGEDGQKENLEIELPAETTDEAPEPAPPPAPAPRRKKHSWI